jgi:hypothetical protein
VLPVPPPHPLPGLATYELTRYRRELEHGLTVTTTAPIRALLRTRLADVLAEQESRARLRDRAGR